MSAGVVARVSRGVSVACAGSRAALSPSVRPAGVPCAPCSPSCLLQLSAVQHQRRWASDSSVAVPVRRRPRRYRDSATLASVIQSEAPENHWNETMVEECLALIERTSMRSFNRVDGHSVSNTDFFGRETRNPTIVLTVESFKRNLAPEERIALGLPRQVLMRLLQLFVPEQEWMFEYSEEEQHNRRMMEWLRFQPNSPGTTQSLEDLEKTLPEKDFIYVKELAHNPPRKAYPSNWPVRPI